jgi:hypothetical protein
LSYAVSPLVLSGTGFQDLYRLQPQETLNDIFIGGALVGLLVPPLTHALHGQGKRALRALWMPVMAGVAVGGGVGVLGLTLALMGSGGGTSDSMFAYAAYGALAAAAGAWLACAIYDVVDTYRNVDRAGDHAPQVSFGIAPTNGGAVAGLSGSF